MKMKRKKELREYVDNVAIFEITGGSHGKFSIKNSFCDSRQSAKISSVGQASVHRSLWPPGIDHGWEYFNRGL